MNESQQLLSIEVTNQRIPNKKVGNEKNMKFCKVKRVLAGIILAVFATPLLAAQAHAESNLRVGLGVADNAITALQDTCDPTTGLPNPGDAACIGIETTIGTSSGVLEGTYLTEVNFAVLANGAAPVTSIETFTGTLSGRGAGSVTVLEIDNITPSGALTGKWSVLKGTGSGALVGVTGAGKVTGTYDATTGLATGTLSGVLHFHK